MHRLIILVSAMFCLLVVCFVIATFYACANYRHSCRRRKKADMEAGGGMELKKIGAKLANGSSVVSELQISDWKFSCYALCTSVRNANYS